jgi:hypothetical protein
VRRAARAKRIALVGGAVACLMAAAFLALLANDVLAWNGAMRSGDVRYRQVPSASGLWSPSTSLGGLARDLLGIDDDLAFRQAVRALELAQLGGRAGYKPGLVLQRADAQARLQALAASGGDRVRRSRATGLLGVLELATPTSDPRERSNLLSKAITDFQKAIALDPGNEEAKYNLEAALRARGVQTVQGGPTPNASAGRAGARSAATGAPGSGY